MRNNQPVTGHEVVMRDDMVIVSKTDEKGKIQFVNKDFMDIAGFTKEELIGQPHNIIRHPDMPPEAFEDMWRDLKAGLPWSGFVKNRVKNGDHYWVHANAMPEIENGRLTGYISIRSKPDAATIRAVDSIYRLFRENKASGMSIEHGRIVKHDRKSKISRYFERISSKVLSASAALALMIILVGGVGFYVSSQVTESLRTVYEDRTICAGQLAEISRLLQGTMYDLQRLTSAEKKDTDLVKESEDYLTQIDKTWADYASTYLTPEEKSLADLFDSQRKKLLETTIKPALAVAKANNSAELEKIVEAGDKPYDESLTTLTKLVDLQMNVAKDEYEKSKIHHKVGTWLSIGVILLGLIVSVLSSKYLRRILDSKFSYLDERLNSIAGGNYKTDIAVGNDEFQNILVTVKALQAKLAYGVLEKKELEREKKENQEALANRFESEVGGVVNGMSTAATELQSTAESMGATAEETSRQSTAVAAASEQATANVQTVSAATEELASSVKEIQNQIAQSTKKINETVLEANTANDRVRSLSEAAQKIGSVIDIIHQIAGQTNLLALNATIEAARAGEAGKGFAVVASEVKHLAGQTAKATEEISQQVGHIQEETRNSVNAIQRIASKIEEVNKIAQTIEASVAQQGSATSEIARNVTEAATGTQEVTSNMVGVREAAQGTGAAAAQVLSAASEVAKYGEMMKTKVRIFLEGVRGG